MAHPQSSNRGMVAFKRVDIGGAQLTYSSTTLLLNGGLALSGQTSAMTETASGFKMPAGLALSGKTNYITQNSTGVIFPALTAIPSTRSAAKWAFGTNSTGANFVAVNTTGTTWKYLNVTSVLPS